MTILTESSHSMATVRNIYKNWIGHITIISITQNYLYVGLNVTRGYEAFKWNLSNLLVYLLLQFSFVTLPYCSFF